MQRKLLQEKSLNQYADNSEKSLNIDLSSKSKLIPYSNVSDMLGLNDLYMSERDACDSYRMIFTVNPVCTNVLYNAVTEPVYMEGSYSAFSLVESSVTRSDTDIFPIGVLNQSASTVDQIAAVRDTEFSHEKIGNFKYHCGYDIFNNHLLRTEDFEHVKMATDKFNKEEFNTLFDFAVDYNGDAVKRVLGENEGPIEGRKFKENVRMYQLDNLKTMSVAFYDELRTVDGWYGFYNSGYINLPNAAFRKNMSREEEEISINKVLNNETPCSFIDFYPDRTLYSFIPKVNRYKKRLERNWDCGIVYPYKSDYDMFNRVMLNFSGTSEEWENPETGDGWKKDNPEKIPNAVRVSKYKIVYNNVGDEMVEMHSLLRHTLNPGDTIRIYYTTSDYTTGTYEEIFRFSVPVRIVSIGDAKGNDEDRCFTIKMQDIITFCGIIEEESEDDEEVVEKRIGIRGNDGEVTDEEISFFYRKIENGCDDKYYFRKFKKMKNFEYIQCTSANTTAEEMEQLENEAKTVIKEPSIITEDSPDAILFANALFKKTSRPLDYTQNKIAFAENIYGDRVAQVIFNDDICTAGLKDNLGRPLTRVYFTAVKTNRGHDEWYNSGITSADTVEFSHCFGEITSGLDLPKDDAISNFNVRQLYNVFSGDCQNQEEYLQGLLLIMEDAPTGDYIDGTPLPIESGITFDDFDEFYGDIVEFSRTNFTETTIEKMYHRFNTAQRECLLNTKYYDIHYDELTGDLYDLKEQGDDHDKFDPKNWKQNN